MKRFDFIKSIENESIRNILFMAFALFFTLPFLIFFFIVNYYDLLDEKVIQFSIALSLAFSLLGLILIRYMTNQIISFSNKAKKITSDTTKEYSLNEKTKLKSLADTFRNLVTKLKDNTIKLDKRIFESSALRELTVITSRISDFNELLEIVLEKLMYTTDSSSGMMLSISDDGDKMKVEAARGIDKGLIPEKEIDIDSAIADRVLKENNFLVCDDPAHEPIFNKQFEGIFTGEPIIVKAIKARSKNIAVLILSRGKDGSTYKDSDMDYILTALGQIAFAVDNAQLIRELKNSYDELKEMQQKLVNYERVAAIHETVVTLNDKINNPLTIIQRHAELMRQNFSNDDINIGQSLDAIESAVKRCNEIMTKLKNISEPAVKIYADLNISMIDIDNSKFTDNEEPGEVK
ncbi:MAG TPA: hypothetical protein ENH82_12515 [bacterium]|nr:hypothetical protein [bacterium]